MIDVKVRSDQRRVTLAEWSAEAVRRFGPDTLNWRFKCPSCGYVASVRDWKNAGAHSTSAGYSCIGRWLGSKQEIFTKQGGPCNYAGGGLFRLNPVIVVHEGGEETPVFEFAPGPNGEAS